MGLEGYGRLIENALQSALERERASAKKRGDVGADVRAHLARYADRPNEFTEEILGKKQWGFQRYSKRKLMSERRVAISSCRKSSKTEDGANLTIALTCTAPTRAIITSATGTQVKNNVWTKVRKNHATAKIPLPGRCGMSTLYMPDPDWYAIGISTDRPGNIMGYHADVTLDDEDDAEDPRLIIPPDPFLEEKDLRRAERDQLEVLDEELWKWKKVADKARLFVFLDEYSQIREMIADALEGSFMGNFYTYAPFNPTFDHESAHPARKALKPNSGWHRIHVSGRPPPMQFHGPLAGEPDSMFDFCFHDVPRKLMTDKWVDDTIAKWGPDTAGTLANLYGLPSSAETDNAFIPYHILELAFDREMPDSGRVHHRHIGFDVAGSKKGDWSVAQLWVCGAPAEEEQWRWADPTDSADRVIALSKRWGVGGQSIPSRNIHIDATGGSLGHTLVGYFRKQRLIVDGVDFGSPPKGDWHELLPAGMNFLNRKSELLWVLRCALQQGKAAISRRFVDTIRQAQWYSYKDVVRGGETVIACAESKEEIKSKFGRSPDNLEAAILAWSRGARRPSFGSLKGSRDLGRLGW